MEGGTVVASIINSAKYELIKCEIYISRGMHHFRGKGELKKSL